MKTVKYYNGLKSTKMKVVESFTNGFAQKFLKLEDGTQIFISYGEDEIEIVEGFNAGEEKFEDVEDMLKYYEEMRKTKSDDASLRACYKKLQK